MFNKKNKKKENSLRDLIKKFGKIRS